MRTKLVKRHYCDFCRKAGQVASIVAAHETTCLRNPARPACYLCAEDGATPVPMAELIATMKADGLAAVREKTGDCPACNLAAIIQSLPAHPGEDDYIAFDYAEEKKRWREDHASPMGAF